MLPGAGVSATAPYFYDSFRQTVPMLVRYAAAAALSFLSLSAAASGFDTNPPTARTLGLGGASVAYTRSLAGLVSNPGLLGQWADSVTRVELAFSGQVRRSSFLSTDTRQVTNQQLNVLPGGSVLVSHPLNKHVALGLALTTPYGFDTRWPSNWPGRSVVQASRLYVGYVQPTVGVHLTDNFSVGAGVMYGYGSMHQERALGQYDDPAAQATLEASGGGVGFNAGVYGRSGENLSFGISFRSGLSLKMNNGNATFSGVPARDAALLPAATSFTHTLRLPSTLAIGITDQVNKKILVTFDFVLSGWSGLDSLNYDLAATATTPALRVHAGRHYEDALAFRAGLEYTVSPALTVRGGVRYDETPVRDEYISPDFIDASLLGGTLGLSYSLGQRLSLDAAYGLEAGGQRTARVTPSRENIANVAGTYHTLVQRAAVGISLQLF
jgi:long-chain fatty acid transport protein